MMPRIWSLFQMSCSVPVPHVWANAGTWAVLWYLGMFCCLQHRAYLWSKVFCGHSTLLKSHLEENHPPGMLKIITAVFGLPPESQSTGTYKIKFGSLYFSGRARWRALLRVGSWPFSLLWPWLVLAGTRVFNREQPSPRCWPGFFTKGQAGSRTSCSCSSFSQRCEFGSLGQFVFYMLSGQLQSCCLLRSRHPRKYSADRDIFHLQYLIKELEDFVVGLMMPELSTQGGSRRDMERSRAVHTLPGDGRWDPKCVQWFCRGHGISQEISTHMALMCS